MGKIRTRTIGVEEVEEKQKKEQKLKSDAKKEKKAKKEPQVFSKALEELKSVEAKEKMEKADEAGEDIEEAVKIHKKVAAKLKPRKGQLHPGKKYKAAAKKVEKDKAYAIGEAVAMLKKIKYAEFDESVELHLNVAETGLKGEVELPHSTGKTVNVKVVDDAVLEQLEKGVIDFDVLVTHPSYMPRLAKYARTLGPKGLMPNPKSGTVSTNPEEVVKKFAKGTLRYKTEAKFPLIHQLIGKISLDEKAIVENAEVFLNAVGKSKIKAAFIKTTMSPSVRIQVG